MGKTANSIQHTAYIRNDRSRRAAITVEREEHIHKTHITHTQVTVGGTGDGDLNAQTTVQRKEPRGTQATRGHGHK